MGTPALGKAGGCWHLQIEWERSAADNIDAFFGDLDRALEVLKKHVGYHVARMEFVVFDVPERY